MLRQVSKDLPLFLYGHAMGGLLVITLILRNPSLKIAGIFILDFRYLNYIAYARVAT